MSLGSTEPAHLCVSLPGPLWPLAGCRWAPIVLCGEFVWGRNPVTHCPWALSSWAAAGRRPSCAASLSGLETPLRPCYVACNPPGGYVGLFCVQSRQLWRGESGDDSSRRSDPFSLRRRQGLCVWPGGFKSRVACSEGLGGLPGTAKATKRQRAFECLAHCVFKWGRYCLLCCALQLCLAAQC